MWSGMSAIDGQPRSASALALVDCELLALPATVFRALLDERPHIALQI
jgi:CRP-like cAMP-binding protein